MDELYIAQFQTILMQWWESGGARSFLWRDAEYRTPYRAVLAELMLRRTRAKQAERVYRAFLERFPTLKDAIIGDREEQRQILYPLGLAWRVEEILSFLDVVHTQDLTELPTTVELLQGLPGIGDYVSNAVACFAGDDSAATLIDVNVTRVLGRVFGLPVHAEARRRKPMRELAYRAVDRTQPDSYHYALLDFAALVCTARRPKCSECPMATICQFKVSGGACHAT